PHTPITFSLYDPPPTPLSGQSYSVTLCQVLHVNDPGLARGVGDGPFQLAPLVDGHLVFLHSPELGDMTRVDSNGSFTFVPKAVGSERVNFIIKDRNGVQSDGFGSASIDILPCPPPVAQQTSDGVTPGDPNEIIGPAGFGAAGFLTPDETLPYTIFFENQPTASAPAQVVTVTQQLDPDLDYSTFQVGEFGLGGMVVSVPQGLPPGLNYASRIDARATL